MSMQHGSDDTRGFQQGWEQLMGTLDAVLDDARANAAALQQRDETIHTLLARAEQERGAAERIFHELMAHRATLAQTLDEAQRALAVAGLPLRGEIS